MNIKKTLLCVTAAALLAGSLAACSQKSVSSAQRTGYESAYDISYDDTGEISFESAMPVALNASGKSAAGSAIPLPGNRKWVITMNLTAETEDLDAALTQLSAKIQELNGYVESQSITGSSTASRSRYAYLTIRVPAEQVDQFAEDVSGMTNLVSTSRRVEDITLSYTDTEGRLNALKTEEARLLELMEQAETMSDLLDIEERLTEVRYQLENYTSTLRLYDNQVDYATVELRVNEVEKYTPAEQRGFWQKIADGLSDSIVDLGHAIVDFISWLIIDLPYLLVIALLAWLATALTRRCLRRKKAKKQAKEEKKETEEK